MEPAGGDTVRLIRAVPVIAFFLLWELVVKLGFVEPYLLSPPSVVSCTSPSSVPIHITPSCKGDSDMVSLSICESLEKLEGMHEAYLCSLRGPQEAWLEEQAHVRNTEIHAFTAEVFGEEE